MNSSKTKSLVFSVKRDKPYHPPLFLNNTAIEEVDHHTHLGSILSGTLSWKSQIIAGAHYQERPSGIDMCHSVLDFQAIFRSVFPAECLLSPRAVRFCAHGV